MPAAQQWLLEGSGFTGHGAIAGPNVRMVAATAMRWQQRNYHQCAFGDRFLARNSVIKRMIPKNPAAAKSATSERSRTPELIK